MTNGWIKIHRKLFDKNWSQLKKYAWLWLIAKAQFSNSNRGVVKTTLPELIREWGVSKSTIYRWLMSWDAEIEFRGKYGGSAGHRTIRITIKNYDKYQADTKNMKSQWEVDGKSVGSRWEVDGKLRSKNDVKSDSSKPLRKEESKKIRKKEKELSKSPGEPALRRQFSDYFVSAYKECHGEEYAWEGAKDGKHLTTLMKRAKNDLELFKRKVDALFGHQLSWVEGGRTLGLLVNQWNKLTVQDANEKIDWDRVTGFDKRRADTNPA